jgi:hypothetical protein
MAMAERKATNVPNDSQFQTVRQAETQQHVRKSVLNSRFSIHLVVQQRVSVG